VRDIALPLSLARLGRGRVDGYAGKPSLPPLFGVETRGREKMEGSGEKKIEEGRKPGGASEGTCEGVSDGLRGWGKERERC